MENTALTSGTTVAIHPDILATPMGEDLVMLNVETGTYFGLENVAKRIWQLIESPTTIGTVVETICNEFEVDEETCEKDVIRFITGARNAKLITVT